MAIGYMYNPFTGTLDEVNTNIPDGVPGSWDASSGNLPTVVVGTADWWIISVAGTLPLLGDVVSGDYIIYDGTNRTVIHYPMGSNLITNTTVISNITNAANWTGSTYTGSLTDLVQDNYYIDAQYEYIFNGTILYRIPLNSATPPSGNDLGDGINIQNTPPVSPADGDTYIVSTAPTGAWAGQSDKVATWDATAVTWTFITPLAGDFIWLTGTVPPAFYYYIGTVPTGSWNIQNLVQNARALVKNNLAVKGITRVLATTAVNTTVNFSSSYASFENEFGHTVAPYVQTIRLRPVTSSGSVVAPFTYGWSGYIKCSELAVTPLEIITYDNVHLLTLKPGEKIHLIAKRLSGNTKNSREYRYVDNLLISNSTVISNITDSGNWDTTGYIGSLTGLVRDNYYFDGTYEYRFDGTTLYRTNTLGTGQPSNILYLNATEPEIEGKQYQSFANANAFLLTQTLDADNLRDVEFSGVWTEDVDCLKYVTYTGDGPETSVINGDVTFAEAGENNPNQSYNNVINCTINNLKVDGGGTLTPVTYSAYRSHSYVPRKFAVRLQTPKPTSGTFQLVVNGQTTASLNYNANGTDVYNAIIALGAEFAGVTVIDGSTVTSLTFSITLTGLPATTSTLTVINNTNATSVIVTPLGQSDVENIDFDYTPVSGSWKLSYEYNSVVYYSGLLNYNATDAEILTEIQGIFTAIQTAEGIDLGISTITASGFEGGGNSLVITFIGYPGSSVNLFEVVSSVPGVYSSFTGQVGGMTTDVTITANTVGVAGNTISIGGDGISNITTLIANWNFSCPPSKTCTLTSGDGTQIPDNKTSITLSGGEDAYNYSLEGMVGIIDKFVNLDNCTILNSTLGTGENGIQIKNSLILGGDFSSFSTYCNLINTKVFSDSSTVNAIIFPTVVQIYDSIIEDTYGMITLYGILSYNSHISGINLFNIFQGSYSFVQTSIVGDVSFYGNSQIYIINSKSEDITINIGDTLTIVASPVGTITNNGGTVVNTGDYYNNTTSGLSATEVQGAIDEMNSLGSILVSTDGTKHRISLVDDGLGNYNLDIGPAL